MNVTEPTRWPWAADAASRQPATWRAGDRLLERDGGADAARRPAPPQSDRAVRPSTPRPGPQLSEAHELLRRVSVWPFIRVDLQRDRAALHSGARDALIARLNLLTGAL